jgi:CDP-glucose 4,6-dehydratase
MKVVILAQALYEKGSAFASGWNFGPGEGNYCSVQEVVNLLISGWGDSSGWKREGLEQPHEANLLKLDCSKARTELGWAPRWNLEVAIQKIIEWQKAFQAKENMQEVSLAQINQYMSY